MELVNYLSLFPGASREKDRFMALAEAVLRQVLDLDALAAQVQPGFSFASAEGNQLDALAESIGIARGAGMTDEAFRQLLLAKLKRWTWDGTNEGVSEVLPAGVTQSDNGDGTVTVSPSGTEQGILPVPAGIGITT